MLEWKPDAQLGGNTKGSLHSPEFDVLMETIRKAREAAGLSQREVARRLGYDPTVYGKTERGDRVLDVVEFVGVARAIGTDPMKLFGDFLISLQQKRLLEEQREPGTTPTDADRKSIQDEVLRRMDRRREADRER